MKTKVQQRKNRHSRIRARVKGTLARPRLSVFKSNKHVYVQLINDEVGATLVALSDLSLRKETGGASKKVKEVGSKMKQAELIGEAIAVLAGKKKITKAVFDRGGFRYGGVVKAVAENARKAGLEF